MKKANDILLKTLGILLLTGAMLKGYQLLTEPAANADIWSNRYFLIFIVEFEIALGIWLLSGLFKKAAWLVALTCFSLFSFITLYKGLTGAESCGCFGSVHVNPWITLFAIDIPAVIALAVFRPALSFLRKQESVTGFVRNVFAPWPPIPRFATIFSVGIVILAATGCVLGFNKPEKSTSSYEVLEPETWIGKELPIIDYIDIGEKLRKGNWLILFYHHDCPDCLNTIKKLNKTRYELNIAIIEVPPYGNPVKTNSLYGRLLDIKEWFITTPAIVLLKDSKVAQTWEQELPDWGRVLDNIYAKTKGNSLLIERR